MSTRLSLILSLIFALLQGTFLPPVFLEGFLVVFLSLTRPYHTGAIALFSTGVIFDLLQNQSLGTTALIFLAAGFLVNYLSKSFPLNQPVVLASFVLIINTVRHLLLFGKFELLGSLVLFAVSFFLFWLLLRSNFSSLFTIRAGAQIRV